MPFQYGIFLRPICFMLTYWSGLSLLIYRSPRLWRSRSYTWYTVALISRAHHLIFPFEFSISNFSETCLYFLGDILAADQNVLDLSILRFFCEGHLSYWGDETYKEWFILNHELLYSLIVILSLPQSSTYRKYHHTERCEIGYLLHYLKLFAYFFVFWFYNPVWIYRFTAIQKEKHQLRHLKHIWFPAPQWNTILHLVFIRQVLSVFGQKGVSFTVIDQVHFRLMRVHLLWKHNIGKLQIIICEPRIMYDFKGGVNLHDQQENVDWLEDVVFVEGWF